MSLTEPSSPVDHIDDERPRAISHEDLMKKLEGSVDMSSSVKSLWKIGSYMTPFGAHGVLASPAGKTSALAMKTERGRPMMDDVKSSTARSKPMGPSSGYPGANEELEDLPGACNILTRPKPQGPRSIDSPTRNLEEVEKWSKSKEL